MLGARWVLGLVAQLLVAGWLVALWALFSWTARSASVPSPVSVATAAAQMLASEDLAGDVLASVTRVALGFLLAASFAVVLALLTIGAGRFHQGVRFGLEWLRSIPPIAWVPLAVLWAGLGDRSAVLVVFLGAFFPIYAHVLWAISSCDRRLLEMAQSLGTTSWFILLRVRLPAALPGVAAGLRTGLGLAWTSLVAAELVGAQSGLGYRIQVHRLLLDTDRLMADMLCIGLLGAAMTAAFRFIEGRLFPWSEQA